jgi:hypothetical protein
MMVIATVAAAATATASSRTSIASPATEGHYCSEGARGEVRLIRQRSGSPCIFNRTWGRDQNGVWVDRGCRADFEVRR